MEKGLSCHILISQSVIIEAEIDADKVGEISYVVSRLAMKFKNFYIYSV